MDPALIASSILGVIQAVKEAGLPSRFAPLAAVLVGAAYGVGEQLQITSGALNPGALVHAGEGGIIYGLSAVGLFATVKGVQQLRAPAAAEPVPVTPALLPGIGVVVGTAPAPETPATS